MSKMGCWAHNAHNTLLTLNQDIDCKIKSLPKKFAPIFTTERLILMNNPKNTKQEKTFQLTTNQGNFALKKYKS